MKRGASNCDGKVGGRGVVVGSSVGTVTYDRVDANIGSPCDADLEILIDRAWRDLDAALDDDSLTELGVTVHLDSESVPAKETLNVLASVPALSILQSDEEVPDRTLPKSGAGRQGTVVRHKKLSVSAVWLKPLFLRARNLFHDIMASPTPDLSLKKSVTRIMIVLSPMCYSAFNMRKSLILSGEVSPVQELHLLNLIFTKFSKSNEAWAHRRWILEHLFHTSGIDLMQWDSEFSICAKVAQQYPKNYYCWCHRSWCISRCADFLKVSKELEWADRWINSNISDHSGMHYKIVLLAHFASLSQPCNCSVALPCTVCTRILAALQQNRDMICFYPGHEALWAHRRALLNTWKCRSCYETVWSHQTLNHSTDNTLTDADQTTSKTDTQCFTPKSERDFVTTVLNDKTVCHFEMQRRLASRYSQWLDQYFV
ncbi:protein prenylyltransferase [Pelomyxa schiedti]|nr:protein prenylyltransferase [Pelomyxa schiedti]